MARQVAKAADLSALVVPTVHLNGTSKRSLVGDLEKAFDALGAAYASLRECAPNGRDYYPQGPDALTLALEQHASRLERVDAVREELEFLIGEIEK